ncbi:putative histone-lysine N-methyltransferase ATXR3-like [Dorcoceras hygrometricum]|uniref:Putative histone-lysine N-methyltransferase ATXR3-like n=1 Tax=Dorcoceras hygrometricum TaxID=472368 RepID=A0A2Z7BQW3_9LAMI|nr:putative histone-lysine N-methyltransferase ATXR3-like [Dorcoceras hygrometricum]
MQHAIINAMKCMRAIKDRIARPVYQLANHHNQPLYPHGVSTGEIIGTTHLLASHNVALNQVINQSVNQAQDVCMYANQYSIHNAYDSIPMSTLKAVKSAQFVPSTVDFYLNRFTKAGHKQLKQVSFLLLRQSRHDAPRTSNPEDETSGRTIEFHCTKKPATSRSSPRSFYSVNWVTIRRSTHKESNATKIAQNNGRERRQSTGKELR